MKKLVVLLIGLLLLSGCSIISSTTIEEQKVQNITEISNVKEQAGKLQDEKNNLEQKAFTVVVDPGHGGNDTGAIANNIIEKDINLLLSIFLKENLEDSGIQVKLTRENDVKIPLDDRAAFASQIDADLFVSIHHNTNDYSYISGTEVYYNETQSEGDQNPFPRESKELAQFIHDSLTEGANLNPMGVKEGTYRVLRKNSVPSVLVEVAFLTNANDASRLKSESELKHFATLISEGILRYIEKEEGTLKQF